MIDNLRFDFEYEMPVSATIACPLFAKQVDLRIDPKASTGHVLSCMEHWIEQARILATDLYRYSKLFADDFCEYAREDIDSMIEDSDYPRIDEDLFIDLREVLLRWNIPEHLAISMVKRVEKRAMSGRGNRNLRSIKRFLIEEIVLTIPLEDQPYHLVRPPMEKPQDILKYIVPLYFTISTVLNEVKQVYYSLDCAWEEEFGLAWLIREGELLYVGSDKDLLIDQPLEYYRNLEGNYVFGNILMKHEMPNLR